MKHFQTSSFIVLLGILLASLLGSCSSNINRAQKNYSTKEASVNYFNQLDILGGYQITLFQDSVPDLKIKTPSENHDKIETWVKNNVLHIQNKSRNINPDEIHLEITIHQLESINIQGGVSLITKGNLEINNININVQGGANIDMNLTANNIQVKGEGGVNMQFKGTCKNFTATTEGASNIDADQMKSQTVNCRVSGVGNASVYATDMLHATVEGLGKISYRGNPTIEKQVNGIGLVYKK